MRRTITAIVSLVALSGCASPGSTDSQYPGSEDTRRINQRADAINTGWQQYTTGVNACLSGVHRGALPVEAFAPCIADAYQSSAFLLAVSNLRGQVEQTRDRVDSGDCRSALDRLATRLRVLTGAVGHFKHDADVGTSSAYRTDTATVTRAWDTSVNAEIAMTHTCGGER
jgi:hypothetical protein